jgi:hypothetical protein
MEGVHYQGNLESPVGKTSFGYFDGDPAFIEDAPKVADYIARRLGWPTVDIEISQEDLYNAFEEAILEFSSKVNSLNIEDNLILIQGNEQVGEFSDLTGKHVTGTPLREAIRLSKAYGSEVGHGGSVDWHKDFITLEAGKQDYDIRALFQDKQSDSLPSRNIVIKTIFHSPPPASERYSIYDGGYAYGGGVFGEFEGFGAFGAFNAEDIDAVYTSDRHIMYPAYEDVLRIQSVEFHDQIRRSQFSYILRNGRLRIFPIPDRRTRLWFEFAYEDELNDAEVVAGDIADVTSDYSDAPLYVKEYGRMNGPSRRWIYQYALAVAMHKLGVARSKFGGATPTPNDQFQLDGPELKSEAQQRMDRLEDQLDEKLQRLTRSEMMQRKVEEQEAMKELFKNTPLGIYVA